MKKEILQHGQETANEKWSLMRFLKYSELNENRISESRTCGPLRKVVASDRSPIYDLNENRNSVLCTYEVVAKEV